MEKTLEEILLFQEIFQEILFQEIFQESLCVCPV